MKIFKPHFIKIIFLAFILLIVSPPVQARKNINPARKVSTRMMSENSHRSNSIKERMRAMTPEESVRDRVIFYDSTGYQTEEEIRRFCISSLQNGTTFEGKVSGCPQLAHQIVWQRPDGSKVDFERWSPSQKVRINELFDRINRNERDLGVRCPRPEDGVNVELRRIYISENEAFDMYAASVAQAIYIESNNLVPWSLRNNPPAENEAILDSSQYFSIITSDGLGSLSVVRRRFSPGTSYRLPAWHYASEALSCDPRVPYNFLSGLNSSTHTTLIQSSQRDTIKALSLWFHKNAFHDPNPPTYFPSFDEWVRDFIFLESRLARRTSGIGETAAQGILMRKGCHGAANLFLELARGINIPIRIFWYADQPFVSDTFNYAPAHMGIAFHWTQPDYKVVIQDRKSVV